MASTGTGVHMMSQGPRVPSVPDAKAAWHGEAEEGHPQPAPQGARSAQVSLHWDRWACSLLSTVRKLWPDPIAALPASPSVGPAQGRGQREGALGRKNPARC